MSAAAFSVALMQEDVAKQIAEMEAEIARLRAGLLGSTQGAAVKASVAPEAAAAASAEQAAEGAGNLENYKVVWSMESTGYDFQDSFARIKVTGRLLFAPDIFEVLEDDMTEVGLISVIQYRKHYIENNGLHQFEIFDETEEEADLYHEVILSMQKEDEYAEELQGDWQYIQRMSLDPAHRGYGLGLFMIEAADTLVNGHMSTQFIKPFPLQFEGNCGGYGFPEPPREGVRQALADARQKLTAYYRKIGFETHGTTEYMLRWNGYRLPDLREVLGEARLKKQIQNRWK